MEETIARVALASIFGLLVILWVVAAIVVRDSFKKK